MLYNIPLTGFRPGQGYYLIGLMRRFYGLLYKIPKNYFVLGVVCFLIVIHPVVGFLNEFVIILIIA